MKRKSEYVLNPSFVVRRTGRAECRRCNPGGGSPYLPSHRHREHRSSQSITSSASNWIELGPAMPCPRPNGFRPDDQEDQARLAAFLNGLQELGWNRWPERTHPLRDSAVAEEPFS